MQGQHLAALGVLTLLSGGFLLVGSFVLPEGGIVALLGGGLAVVGIVLVVLGLRRIRRDERP